MTTAQHNAELEDELAELRLTQAIRADRLKLAHQIAELRERQAQESSKSIGPTSETTEMCEMSRPLDAMFLQEDFLASHSVSPGSAEARQMTARSGRRCLPLSSDAGPLGCLAKTCLAGGGNSCELTQRGNPYLRPSGQKAHLALDQAVRLWPTPTAMSDTGGQALCKWGGSGARRALRKIVSIEELNGALNPNWVEWLMGYPIGHTALSASETALFLKWRKSSRARSTSK